MSYVTRRVREPSEDWSLWVLIVQPVKTNAVEAV
jgi:hypothetical protein